MKKKLSVNEYICIASMLFGLFFGAGNLIFPVHMGQMAGSNVISAIIGFLITGVGMPLLGVIALAISKSNGLYELASKIGKPYSLFFTCLLYLTIGPFFAIPRCATTSFTVGIENILSKGTNLNVALFIFSLIFFSLALFFSLRPGKILIWVGKILNPCFLLFLGILLVVALLNPSISINETIPEGTYLNQAFSTGFLEGYNTMDALASLAFGIVVVNVIKDLGVSDSNDIAKSTAKAGIFSCLIMATIYVAVTIVGTQSKGLFQTSINGGIALAQIAKYYLGNAGLFVLASTVILACLKTSIGLITSCGETFASIFPKGPSYKSWIIIFSASSFLFSNFGLNSIISYSLPVLMFLYPLAITLIFLSLFGHFFDYDRKVFVSTTIFAFFAAICAFIKALPSNIFDSIGLSDFQIFVGNMLPFSNFDLGWISASLAGLVIGLILHFISNKKNSLN